MDFVLKPAYAADLGPSWSEDDEQWPREYRSYLSHAAFNRALVSLTQPSPPANSRADVQGYSVTFQPFVKPSSTGNEDRHVIQYWELPSGTWTFAAIFDGHAGHETADYALSSLPSLIRASLENVLSSSPQAEEISTVLSDTIRSFDKSIGDDLAAILPADINSLEDEEVKGLINDQMSGGIRRQTILRCMRGCTALFTLIDPPKENMWVANLGDCQAVLGQRDDAGKVEARLLTSLHNGSNPAEVERVRTEHPGEDEAVLNKRVLGAIAVFRAFGDHTFKLPATFTHKVFLNAEPGFRVPAKVRQFIGRNLTPPYVSAVPDVVHRHLDPSSHKFVVLCSDGLTDLYEGRGTEQEVIERWVDIISREDKTDVDEGLGGNKAISLLKDGLGADLEAASRNLSIDMNQIWVDDTSIIVLCL